MLFPKRPEATFTNAALVLRRTSLWLHSKSTTRSETIVLPMKFKLASWSSKKLRGTQHIMLIYNIRPIIPLNTTENVNPKTWPLFLQIGKQIKEPTLRHILKKEDYLLRDLSRIWICSIMAAILCWSASGRDSKPANMLLSMIWLNHCLGFCRKCGGDCDYVVLPPELNPNSEEEDCERVDLFIYVTRLAAT